MAEQLDRDLARCRWFSIQSDESVGQPQYSAADDLYQDGVLLTLLPLKTTTRAVDVYNAVKEFSVEKKVPLEKLVSVIPDGAPAMIGRHAGFIARCR